MGLLAQARAPGKPESRWLAKPAMAALAMKHHGPYAGPDMHGHDEFLAACRLLGQGKHQAAEALLRDVLRDNPAQTDAALYLALALRALGRAVEAEPVLARALEHAPGDPGLRNLLGVVLLESGRPEQAASEHKRALALARGDRALAAEAMDGLGNCLAALGRYHEAVDAYERALTLAPDSPTLSITLSNMGAALKNAGNPSQAVEAFEAALGLDPADADTWANLGNARQDLGDMDGARLAFERAVQADPDNPVARWGLAMAHIPLFFERQEDIAPAREAYGRALADLDDWLGEGSEQDKNRLVRAAEQAAGRNQPFYLAYHGENDRQLQARYGAMLHRVMAARFPEYGPECARPPASRPRRGKFRLGLASGYFLEHSVWKIPLYGWLAGLDRERFEIHCFHTAPGTDRCTDQARELADSFIHQPHDVPALVRAVAEAKLDGLLYPEIGMDPVCAQLAALRLAPLQAVSLGHPMTTGLPTMDLFLSSELMEPPLSEGGGDGWYTERLVPLPNLSIWYEPVRREPARLARADFGLDPDEVVYFCPQSLFKYLPRHDHLLPDIARQVRGARFVFIEHRRSAELTRRFRARLGRAFTDRTRGGQGLDPERHLLFLESQPPDRYLALMRCCDVFLDSLGWAGFNTAMEAAGCGLPIITCPQGPMRGRHGGAVAIRLGLDDDGARGVARSQEEYVALAVRAGNGQDYRQALADRVRANLDRLYSDPEPIRALEEILLASR